MNCIFLYFRILNAEKNEKLVPEEFILKCMICSRCLKVLNIELKATGAEVLEIELGKLVVRYDPEKINHSVIDKIIHDNDFEIIWDKESILAEQIKRWVVNYIWDANFKQNLSDYLAEKLNRYYSILSRNFSKTFGKTIERYSTLLKIERVKECVESKEVSFSEIAYFIGYQNLSALSRQFKRETGMTLTEYTNL